jgi:cleavage and polyadenylation specificity factor subunit 1
LPSAYNYDNYWPVQKVPLHGTPHQVTYYAEQSLYPLIVSVPVVRPLNQVLSSMADQELGLHIENDVTIGDDLQKVYTVDEFEVRIMELEKPSGRWRQGSPFRCNHLKML